MGIEAGKCSITGEEPIETDSGIVSHTCLCGGRTTCDGCCKDMVTVNNVLQTDESICEDVSGTKVCKCKTAMESNGDLKSCCKCSSNITIKSWKL